MEPRALIMLGVCSAPKLYSLTSPLLEPFKIGIYCILFFLKFFLYAYQILGNTEISVFGDLRSLKETKKNHDSFKKAVC